jgi:hypothetical protein
VLNRSLLFIVGDEIVNDPYFVLTPQGLGGHSILVNFSSVLRAELAPDGRSTALFFRRRSDPDGLKSMIVDESLQEIVHRLQRASSSKAP